MHRVTSYNDVMYHMLDVIKSLRNLKKVQYNFYLKFTFEYYKCSGFRGARIDFQNIEISRTFLRKKVNPVYKALFKIYV